MEATKRNHPPFITLGLVVICIVVFLLEIFQGGSQNIATLVKMGAMSNYAVVGAGQWWRLFTAQFLHIGVWHLVSNLVMIYYMGTLLEPMVGHLRFLIIYLLSGVGGNLLGLAFGSDKSISAGASTALFGLFGAVIALSLVHQHNPFIAFLARQSLVLALINLGIDIFLPYIDIYGHLGGLIAGFLITGIIEKGAQAKIRVICGAVLIIGVIFCVRQGMVINF